MQMRDWLTAVIAALILMALGVAATFGWVWIYSTFINTGQTIEIYQAYANRHAPWVGVYAGVPMWFLAGWLIARSRERGRAIDTAFGIGFIYALLDAMILGALGSLLTYVGIVVISISTKAAAAVLGAAFGARA